MICPYVEPILTVLIPKLKEVDVNPMVVTSVLRAIGDLAHVGGKLMAKYVDELLPTLLDILGDASSSQKREVSLWTLAQLVARYYLLHFIFQFSFFFGNIHRCHQFLSISY